MNSLSLSVSAAEKVRLPGISLETNDLTNGLLRQLSARAPRNMLRASYYDGKRAAQQVGTIIPPQYLKLGIVLGWSGKAVDVLARRCNLDGFSWGDGNLADLGADELWDGNFLGTEVSAALTSSLIHGPAFLINTRGGEGEPASLIHAKDAMSATGTWNARTRRLDNLLSITSRDADGRLTGLVLYLDGETIEATRATGREKWEVNVSEHHFGVPAEVLPYKPRLNRPFGASRISRATMSLHDQALRAVVRLDAHMDVYSFPEFWMLGADESIFKNSDGTPKASWQIMLGRIKGIPDDEDATYPRADVKQFPASDPAPHLADINALAKLFARENSLPDTAVAISDFANPTSADSYDASQHELIAEAEGACDDWSPALRRAFVRGLAIQNGETSIPADWKSITTKWRDPRYQSRAAMADAGMKQIAAVPWLAESEVGLELLGLTPQQIRQVTAERRKQQGSSILDRLRAATPGDGDVNQPAE